ncbi:MAG: hypothetical protein MUO76_06225, partial [Anaerolineaceae bacterium]|nr:hypothetical protein [Anaerolineaceae bacterium]
IIQYIQGADCSLSGSMCQGTQFPYKTQVIFTLHKNFPCSPPIPQRFDIHFPNVMLQVGVIVFADLLHIE